MLQMAWRDNCTFTRIVYFNYLLRGKNRRSVLGAFADMISSRLSHFSLSSGHYAISSLNCTMPAATVARVDSGQLTARDNN